MLILIWIGSFMRFQNSSAAKIRGPARFVVLSAVLILWLSIGFDSAQAHARLIESTPVSGTALSAMPWEIVLTFSEEIDLQYCAANLLTVFDEPVTLGSLSTTDDERTLRIAIPDAPTLPPGAYILVWRVLSGADGHVTTGTIAFSAGTGVAPAAISSSDQSRPPWWRIAIRWSELTALALLVGGCFFTLFVSRRPVASTDSASLLLLRVAIALLMVTLLEAGYDLGVSATGSRFFSPPGLPIYRDLILHATSGRSWLAITIATALIGAITFRKELRAAHAIVAFAAGLASLGSLSYAGHAAATAHPIRSIAIDWVHLATVACWFGSLPYLWLSLRLLRSSSPPGDINQLAGMIGRFSKLGLLLMGTIVATGFLRAADQVSGPQTLVDADYGRVLIAKHLLLVPVLVAASANLLVIVPRMRKAQSVNVPAVVASAFRSTRQFISAEIAAAIMILLAAAALTELVPADGPLAVDVASTSITIDERAQSGDLSIWLLGRLTGAANDRYTITVAGTNGKPPENLQRVIVQTSTQINDEQVGDRFDAQPLAGSTGTYVLPALRLGLKGLWNLEIITRRAGVEDVSTMIQIDTTNTGAQPPRLVEDSWRLPRVTIDAWLLIAASMVVLIGGVVAVRLLPGVEPFAVAIIMTMVALITAGFAVQGYRRAIPVSAGTNLVNLNAVEAGSIQRGEDLYATFCLQCHGSGAVGIDEGDPEHPHSGGTNLTDRTTVKQRDGDLYWSITYGIGGTDMPAFDVALSDADRWDMVNYLRSLEENPAPKP